MKASERAFTDREHLISKTYATEEPLAVRIRTHESYTQPKVDFHTWVLDRIPWHGDEWVLDIGCGSGAYIEPVCQRLTQGGRLLAGDLSWGMLCNVAAKSLPEHADLLNGDAMNIPLSDGCCDVVMANHMLYHVPQIEAAMTEIRRVLRPGGRFIGATNTRYSMQEFITEVENACRALGYPIEFSPIPARIRFTLENGWDFIRPFFLDVKQEIIESALIFPEVSPAVAYINSLRDIYGPQLPDDLVWEALMEQVERQIESSLANQGEYRVAKTTGMFVATR
ncbi:MAG: class I SAM-dependent methyltransferase [Chloroflexi bacterium]|nr:class I SAM-dependent methyltransferase [Chloroflexota bacterium]